MCVLLHFIFYSSTHADALCHDTAPWPLQYPTCRHGPWAYNFFFYGTAMKTVREENNDQVEGGWAGGRSEAPELCKWQRWGHVFFFFSVILKNLAFLMAVYAQAPCTKWSGFERRLLRAVVTRCQQEVQPVLKSSVHGLIELILVRGNSAREVLSNINCWFLLPVICIKNPSLSCEFRAIKLHSNAAGPFWLRQSII